MEGGFSFAGVDIADLGLEYVPENNNTYVWMPGSYDVSEESFAAHDGGYYYGATVKPKDFVLRCIFEGTPINNGSMTRINNLFKRGKTGKLIFKRRPWCWYVATVVRPPQLQITNYANGVITLSLRAYYPFARSDQTYILDDDPNEEDLMNNSAMLKGVQWNTSKDFGAMTEQQPIYVYNPGTETAATTIEIEGDTGTGITIYNEATQQTCKITGRDFDAQNETLIIDSLSGKVLIKDSLDNLSYGFLYHDNGFIDLASCYPVERDVLVAAHDRSNVFTAVDPDYVFSTDLIGQNIGFYYSGTSAMLGFAIVGMAVLNNSVNNGSFFISKVVSVSSDGKSFTTEQNLVLDPNQTTTTEALHFPVSITPFNKIWITPDTTMNLTKFVVKYRPTFS